MAKKKIVKRGATELPEPKPQVPVFVKALLTTGQWVELESTVTADGSEHVPHFHHQAASYISFKGAGGIPMEFAGGLPFMHYAKTSKGESVSSQHVVKFVSKKAL